MINGQKRLEKKKNLMVGLKKFLLKVARRYVQIIYSICEVRRPQDTLSNNSDHKIM